MTPPGVGAVVLAAGGSTRLGHPKQLVTLDGRPLVARAAAAALGAGAEPVVVVLGAHADAVRAALGGLAVHPVAHPGWAGGLGSSLGCGVAALAERAPAADAVLVTLADQPLVTADDLRRLCDAWASAADRDAAIVAAAYADTVGVPAVFGRAHLAALRDLPQGAGAGGLLRAAGDRVVRVPVPGAAVDVDTPADLARLRARPPADSAGAP